MLPPLLLAAVGTLLVLTLATGVWLKIAMDSSFTTPYADRRTLPFTQESWIAGDQDLVGSRYMMLRDLVSKHRLGGMTRAEVLDLLGPMEAADSSSPADRYYLGPNDHPLDDGDAWLVLTFDGDRVTNWTVAAN